MQLKFELQNARKQGITINEYMSRVKSLIDALIFTGCKVDEEDQIMYYLGGLGQEYDAVVINVTALIGSLCIGDIRALLLNQESRIIKYNQNHSINSPEVNYIANAGASRNINVGYFAGNSGFES